MNDSRTPGTTRLMLSGIVLMIAGGFSMVSPAVAGKAVVIVIGAILSVAGGAQIFQGVRSEGWTHKTAPLVLGTLILLAGLAVLAHPILGLETLTLMLALFLGVEGLWKIIMSFSYRPAAGWIAMLISGLIAMALGWMIWSQWPLSGLWAVGVFVGVDLLTTGCALVVLAVTLKHVHRVIQEAASV
ncbi:acid-resistance membrane protein [Caulifigura coniformis]|uniref:Acid-resistance membrane protein n=1 Tax=Caulifigura coniformis TaxID=2527983 RepID=A0A517SAB9_9PLAN|nr:HdeD family acid-resistance protein [Caulifigura coniformis]QDT53081.1 acid-resistance membrane protein [Caulifigura coniformis]